MKSATHRFLLDMHSVQSQISIPVSFGDTSRTFRINLSDGGNPYIIEDGCLALLSIKRPSGKRLEAFCDIEDNTTIVYPFEQNTAVEEGIHYCDVTLYDTEKKTIATPRFSMVVSKGVLDTDDLVFTDEDKTFLNAIMSEEASRQDAERERVEAEKSRLEAEARRVEAEEDRINVGKVALEFAERAEQASLVAVGAIASVEEKVEEARDASALATQEANRASEEARLAAEEAVKDIAMAAAGAATRAAEAEVEKLVGELGVVQNTGDSITSVMSQKAVTEEIKVLDAFCKDRYAEYVVDDWVVGSISPATFKDLSSTTRVRSGYHTFNGISKLRISNEVGYKSLWHAYTYDGLTYTRVDGNISFTYGAYDIPIVSGCYYRFLIAYDGDKTASVDFGNHVKFKGWLDNALEIVGTELRLEYGNISNGVEADSTGRVRSDFLRVGKGTLFKSSTYSILLAQYDLDKNFIAMVTGHGGTWLKGIEVDRDCFVRLVVGGKGGVYLDGATATLSAIKNDVKAYIRDCDGDNRYTIGGDKVGWKYSTLDPATGGERLSTGRLLSDYIRADAYTIIESTTQNIGVYQYDENRNFVAFGTEVTWYTRKVTLVDGYIRIVIGGKGGVYLDGTEDVDALTKAVTIKVMRNKNSVFLDNKNVVESEKRLPTYWAEYLDGKKDSIYTERLKIGNHGDIFSFFTDYHMQSNATNTAAILKRIKKEHRIDKHFFGGDIADSTTTANAKVLMDKFAKDFSDIDLLPSMGNHEVQLYNSSYANPTESDVYGLVFKHLETKAHVALENGLYYALDNHAQKIRYIVLNTHTDTSYSFVNDTAQVNWFVERMTELDDGWNVIVMFHRYYDGINNTTGAHNTSPDGALISALLNALNTKTTYSSSSSLFNFTNAKAGVIALISGHTHRDYSEVTASGFPIIATRCDAYDGAMQEIPRTLGDVTEQAIDLFFVDTTARTIKTIRLGAGVDREFTF